ncbi:hypothetical protein BU25DRAFT_203065 [Macroventuria anomochaeta]|uniref:Uncharacterized protein n=1 Tax=Macroventuria anomochaeta TaxID=301207 RepID=A0ACB6RLV7_9PLEO|nr:uncharacterized protein BU25DRAFT_203065 [Macroventuria anomochaeta]KAF2622901.1 hypothetical protein BU25DRAFT_203065 [Macroventuria anomochaeta]
MLQPSLTAGVRAGSRTAVFLHRLSRLHAYGTYSCNASDCLRIQEPGQISHSKCRYMAVVMVRTACSPLRLSHVDKILLPAQSRCLYGEKMCLFRKWFRAGEKAIRPLGQPHSGLGRPGITSLRLSLPYRGELYYPCSPWRLLHIANNLTAFKPTSAALQAFGKSSMAVPLTDLFSASCQLPSTCEETVCRICTLSSPLKDYSGSLTSSLPRGCPTTHHLNIRWLSLLLPFRDPVTVVTALAYLWSP